MRIAVSLIRLACAASLWLAATAAARADILVASYESHSIEWFTNAGKWIDTFASTGAYVPAAIASNPVTGDVVVATNSATLLRFTSKGVPVAGCKLPAADASAAETVLFDSQGDLYVANNVPVGGTSDVILRYPPTVTWGHCQPSFSFSAGLQRASQLAFDVNGNICLASFIDEDVRCFDVIGTLQHDYKSELQATGTAPSVIEPGGLAFDSANHLIVSSAFTGDVLQEITPRSAPMQNISGGNMQPTLIQLTVFLGTLYVPSFYNDNARYGENNCPYYACQDTRFTPDVIYSVPIGSGTVTPFITNHVYGPSQLIFANVTKHHP